MNYRGSALATTVLFLSGCTTPLTPEGAMVGKVPASVSMKCEYLGVVQASEGGGLDKSSNKIGAINGVRNQVALMGGNAFATAEASNGKHYAVMQADAYKCPVYKGNDHLNQTAKEETLK